MKYELKDKGDTMCVKGHYVKFPGCRLGRHEKAKWGEQISETR